MAKILIDGEDFGNRGFMAATMGLDKCLKDCMPDVEIAVFSSHPERDEKLSKLDIEILPGPWGNISDKVHYAISITFELLRCSALRVAGRFNHHIKSPYDQYDAVLHFSLDGFNGAESGIWACGRLAVPFLTRAVCRRPIATLPIYFGPFTNRLSRQIARFFLNRMDIVALREEVSYEYARNLGLKKPKILLACDLAFLLDPAPRERVDEILRVEGINKNDKPFVGFSPNKRVAGILGSSKSMSGSRYVEVMAQAVDYMVEKLDATVCLIPHVYSYDDRQVCQQICEQVNHKVAVRGLQGEYLADELKGVIGSCDMFIGSWMHSTIASTSMGVPTIAIAFSDKFYRLIGKTMGQAEYIIDIRNRNAEELLAEIKAKVDSLWASRERVGQELRERAKIAQEQAWSYGKLIKELVESSRKASVP